MSAFWYKTTSIARKSAIVVTLLTFLVAAIPLVIPFDDARQSNLR